MHSGDGGESWAAQDSGVDDTLNSVSFPSANVGVAVGPKGLVVRTSDGGATWASVESGLAEDLYGVFFLNDDEGWAVGAKSKIIHSTDGGQTWSEQETITSGDSLNGVMFTELGQRPRRRQRRPDMEVRANDRVVMGVSSEEGRDPIAAFSTVHSALSTR